MQKPQQADDALLSMKKAKSLLETMIRMREEGRYCVDIMQQNLAAIGLLKSTHKHLMSRHLETCFAKGMQSGNDKQKERMMEEIKSLMTIANK